MKCNISCMKMVHCCLIYFLFRPSDIRRIFLALSMRWSASVHASIFPGRCDVTGKVRATHDASGHWSALHFCPLSLGRKKQGLNNNIPMHRKNTLYELFPKQKIPFSACFFVINPRETLSFSISQLILFG